jgi:hypothetical protein
LCATTAPPVLIPIRTCSNSAASCSFSSPIAQDAKSGADGALGIVLLRDWGAEDGHPAAAVQK